ncbi:MAG: hypothetical protein M3280_02650 [Actinomycetota bacterium]|nr:hypothetical protein [Actinomycetota bacterium]
MQAPPSPEPSSPERALRSLVSGALIFRWVWLIWMGALAASGSPSLARPVLAWASIGGAAAWTAVLTFRRERLGASDMLVDVAVCGWLTLVSAYVVAEGGVVSGRPFFATGYPLSAPLLWGATRGVATGLVTAVILAAAHLVTRPLNGVPLDGLTAEQVQHVTGSMLNHLVAGVAVGLVSRLLTRSAQALREATTELVAEREHAARLAERESMAREIHDSALQVLALVNKRGRELAAAPDTKGEELLALANLAGEQEKDLRGLILREPRKMPSGKASLREAVESTARSVNELEVTVSSVGPIHLENSVVAEITAAVRQALENVVQHARTKRASVFLEEENGIATVFVRDNGVGFQFDEESLLSAGKVGVLKSMKGRIEELGGTVRITSAPGNGTEVEFRVPTRT